MYRLKKKGDGEDFLWQRLWKKTTVVVDGERDGAHFCRLGRPSELAIDTHDKCEPVSFNRTEQDRTDRVVRYGKDKHRMSFLLLLFKKIPQPNNQQNITTCPFKMILSVSFYSVNSIPIGPQSKPSATIQIQISIFGGVSIAQDTISIFSTSQKTTTVFTCRLFFVCIGSPCSMVACCSFQRYKTCIFFLDLEGRGRGAPENLSPFTYWHREHLSASSCATTDETGRISFETIFFSKPQTTTHTRIRWENNEEITRLRHTDTHVTSAHKEKYRVVSKWTMSRRPTWKSLSSSD